MSMRNILSCSLRVAAAIIMNGTVVDDLLFVTVMGIQPRWFRPYLNSLNTFYTKRANCWRTSIHAYNNTFSISFRGGNPWHFKPWKRTLRSWEASGLALRGTRKSWNHGNTRRAQIVDLSCCPLLSPVLLRIRSSPWHSCQEGNRHWRSA